MSHEAERRKYWGDVVYEVWLRGGNPDYVDDDRIDEHYWDGLSAKDAALREIERHEENGEA